MWDSQFNDAVSYCIQYAIPALSASTKQRGQLYALVPIVHLARTILDLALHDTEDWPACFFRPSRTHYKYWTTTQETQSFSSIFTSESRRAKARMTNSSESHARKDNANGEVAETPPNFWNGCFCQAPEEANLTATMVRALRLSSPITVGTI